MKFVCLVNRNKLIAGNNTKYGSFELISGLGFDFKI